MKSSHRCVECFDPNQDTSANAIARRVILALSVAVLGGAASAAVDPVEAQLSIGIQGSHAEKTDFGLGPRAVVDLGPFDAGLRVVGSFEIYFPGQRLIQEIALESDRFGVTLEGDPDYWEANLNVLYTLGLPLVPLTPYLGGGLNIARLELRDTTDGLFDTERTDKGINVLAGLELDVAGVSPFFEFRYTFQGIDQWVMTGGIVF